MATCHVTSTDTVYMRARARAQYVFRQIVIYSVQKYPGNARIGLPLQAPLVGYNMGLCNLHL